LADCLGQWTNLEVGYPVWKRLRTLVRDSVPQECNFLGLEDTFFGVEQDPVGLELPEEGPEMMLVFLWRT